MSQPVANARISLNFAWTGPNIWKGGASQGGLDVRIIDLKFKGAKMDVSVHLPEKINRAITHKFPFTCRRYHENEIEIQGSKYKTLLKETHPDTLTVTIEQIRNLTLQAGFFEMGRPIGPRVMNSSGQITQQETMKRNDREVRLQIPEVLEIGQTYSLIVTSENLSLSARLVKTELDRSMQEEVSKDSDLEHLSLDELQSLFQKAAKLDKDYESQRFQATINKNILELSKIIDAELENVKWLKKIIETMRKKGVNPIFPQSSGFDSAAREFANARFLANLAEDCKMQ